MGVLGTILLVTVITSQATIGKSRGATCLDTCTMDSVSSWTGDDNQCVNSYFPPVPGVVCLPWPRLTAGVGLHHQLMGTFLIPTWLIVMGTWVQLPTTWVACSGKIGTIIW